ncbi:Altered inheritance of mitochondria protein 18 mitochondrial [Savitreella phatthalungensis]
MLPVLLSALAGYNAVAHRLFCDFRPKNDVGLPCVIDHEQHGRFELVASGTRRVTFLSIRVYNVGIYIAAEHALRVRELVRERAHLRNEDVKEFLLHPEHGTQAIQSISANVKMMVRIVPVRDTDIAHMRDGFVRGISARIEPQTDALVAFKEFFPNPRMKLPTTSVMQLISLPGNPGRLALEIDGHDYGTYTGPRALLDGLIGTYCSGSKVASEEMRQEFVEQLANHAS